MSSERHFPLRLRDNHGGHFRLPQERVNHILERHPDMERYIDKIADALQKADEVTESDPDPRVYRYYKRFALDGGRVRYLWVVVKEATPEGWVVTSHIADRIR